MDDGMIRTHVLYWTVAAFALQSVGCAHQKTVVRGQSHEVWAPVHRRRNKVMKKVDPVLVRVSKKSEPLEEPARKALLYTGLAALVGGFLCLDWLLGGKLTCDDIAALFKSPD